MKLEDINLFYIRERSGRTQAITSTRNVVGYLIKGRSDSPLKAWETAHEMQFIDSTEILAHRDFPLDEHEDVLHKILHDPSWIPPYDSPAMVHEWAKFRYRTLSSMFLNPTLPESLYDADPDSPVLAGISWGVYYRNESIPLKVRKAHAERYIEKGETYSAPHFLSNLKKQEMVVRPRRSVEDLEADIRRGRNLSKHLTVLARNTSITEDEAGLIMEHGSTKAKQELARNSDLSPRFLSAVLKHGTQSVKWYALSNPSTPIETVMAFYEKNGRKRGRNGEPFAAAVIRNPNAPEDVLAREYMNLMSLSNWSRLNLLLASRPELSDGVWEQVQQFIACDGLRGDEAAQRWKTVELA